MTVNIGVNIQRNPNRLNNGYNVGGKYPALVADFDDEYYRANSGNTTFSNLITHARAGNATMTDSDGLIKWAPHNLLTYSEDFTNAVWTKAGTVSVTSNQVIAPNGTLTADLYEAVGSSALVQSVIYSLGYTFKIWVKAVTAGVNNTFRIQGTGGQLSSNFTATTEWQIFEFTPTTLGNNGNWGINRDSSDNDADLYIWGAHLYRSDLGGMVGVPKDARAWTESPTVNLSATTTAILRAGVNLQPELTRFETKVNGRYIGDINNDGRVSSNDANIYANYAAGNLDPNDPEDFVSIRYIETEMHPRMIAYDWIFGDYLDGATNQFYVPTAARLVGPELVTNGTFDSGTTGWTGLLGATLSVTDGVLRVEEDGGDASTGRAYQEITTEVGKIYSVSADFVDTNDNFELYVNTSSNYGGSLVSSADESTPQTKQLFFVATSTSTYIILGSGAPSAGTYAEYDNISVRETSINPTAARYLPRRGHHVYNGYEWVNEGVLAESEARTNLAPYSDMSGATLAFCTRTANAATSPDGSENAFKIEATDNNMYATYNGIISNGESYAVSVYAKAGTQNIIRIANVSSAANGQWFDLANGTLLTNNGAGNTATIEDVGNGWYRCTRYFDSVSEPNAAELFISLSTSDGITSANVGDNAYFYGFQVENNATSSSYIPTSGSSVSRAAETFTIPSTKLPWPSPVYIGDELVTNGTFDTDLTGWTTNGAVWESGQIKVTDSSANFDARARQFISGLTVGKVYALTATIDKGTMSLYSQAQIRQQGTSNLVVSTPLLTDGTFTVYFVYSAPVFINLLVDTTSTSSKYAYFDNISVREINPLSVSIQMDGKISYTKSGSDTFCRWFKDANTYINDVFFSDYKFISAQKDGTTYDQVATDVYFSGDLLEPYSIASRHGSTFINGAVDGVALTANTTPVALPDLSSTDLSLAFDYMGTIKTFRIWDKDLGDTGIAEATAPSLEPSLSLSFDSTESSFIDLGWD